VGVGGWWWGLSACAVEEDAEARFVADDVADESPAGIGTRFGVCASVACCQTRVVVAM
jgi:hypothetical protein